MYIQLMHTTRTCVHLDKCTILIDELDQIDLATRNHTV